MRENELRALVRLLIESEEDVDERPGNLLTEPDDSGGKEKAKEASVAASIGGGPAMPLGAGPSYPNPEPRTRKRARRDIARSAGDAFGGARPVKKN